MKEETNRRTVDELKKRGITQIGNTQSKRGKLSFDLFGFLDMVYFRGAYVPECVGVQACWDYDYEKDHLQKYLSKPDVSDAIRSWLLSGNKFEFWVWAKKKKVRGGKYYTATVQVIPISSFHWHELTRHYKEEHDEKD